MTPREALALARATLLSLDPPVTAYLSRDEVPDSPAGPYVVIDLIATTPEATYEARAGSRTLLQVNCWGTKRGGVLDLAERCAVALTNASFREGQSRYPIEDGYFGVQTDYLTP